MESCSAFYADPMNVGLYVCVGDCGSDKCEGFTGVEEEECPEGCPEPYIIWNKMELLGKPVLNCSATCASAGKPFIENHACVSECASHAYQLHSGPPEQ